MSDKLLLYVLARTVMPEEYELPEHFFKYRGVQWHWIVNQEPFEFSIFRYNNGKTKLNAMVYRGGQVYSPRTPFLVLAEYTTLTNYYANDVDMLSTAEWNNKYRDYNDIRKLATAIMPVGIFDDPDDEIAGEQAGIVGLHDDEH